MKHFYLCVLLIAFFKLNAQIELVSSEVTFFQKPLKTANGIYFSGSNADVGIEPYFYDGSSVLFNLKDINIGTSSSWAGNFYEFQSKIYFSASNTGNNNELYTTDGSEAGTVLFKEINSSNTVGGSPKDFIALGSNLLFTASETTNNPELFVSDGTEIGTVLLKEIQIGQFGSAPSQKTLYNGQVYFSASNGGGGTNSGFEVWLTDGSNAGTNLFLDISSGNGSSYPESFTEHNGLLFFHAQNATNGRELWVTDGTISGTQMVSDINPGSANGLIPETNFFAIQDKLYFEANDGMNGRELWAYDSNTNNVQLIADINPTGDSQPSGFAELNGNLFFSANDGVNGWELFKLDTTTNQVTLIDINPTSSSFANIGAVINNRIYFVADDGVSGRELWVTDGTIAGTQMIADLNPGSGSSFPDYLIDFNGELIFSTTAGIYKFNDSILGINTLESNYTISVYPNPSDSLIKLKGAETIDALEIFDLTGKLVQQYNILQDSYDISDLKVGIYFVKIKVNKATQTIKLIKH